MKRHALFVGVDDYADGNIPNLHCAVSDATDLHGFFKFGAGYDRVELLPNPVGKKEILSRVRELTFGLGQGDFFLFFFAGHGFRVGEDHVLVCAEDFFEDVKYQDDGLPLGQLKRRLSGAFDSALFLDACQSDILATRGGEGIAERDISLILDTPAEDLAGGTMVIVTSCDTGQTAAELATKGHGLFTLAMLDLLKDAQSRNVRLDISDSFRTNLGTRMRDIAVRDGLTTKQRPRFNSTDRNLVLLDGTAADAFVAVPTTSPLSPPATTQLVVCPICGKKNEPKETFKCRECGRDNLCLRHQNAKTFLCRNCAKKAREAEAQAAKVIDVGGEDAESLYEKAEDFFKGRNGVKVDVKKAFKWYLKAAEQGHSKAQYQLGAIYHIGLLGQRDMPEAVKWFRKAAENGYAPAQDMLGDCYYNGEGVDQNYEEAVKWYRKAAEQGQGSAQSRLGDCYCNGDGVEQDYEEAVKWYRKAAEKGFLDAQCNLGNCYDEGNGVGQDYEEAVKWYREAADQGYALAQNNLGWMYENGHGVEQDYEEAVKWYRKAADQGNALAQYNLGDCYYNGNGVEQDYEEAVEWYRKAAEQGDEDAQNRLGNCYHNGEGVEQDDEEAVEWYRAAAEQGNAAAQKNLGWMYEKGHGVEQDYAEAMEWYRKAADQGQADAQNNLGWMYTHGEGVEEDDEEAVKWYRRAVKLGSAAAQCNLGWMYENGHGVEQDYEKAMEWYRKAADQGQADAQNNLGWMYAHGEGVEEDDEEAVKWYRRAVKLGSAAAQCNLGWMYENGHGVEQDYAEAVKWYSKAADQGHAEAQNNLGGCYFNGNGVEQDYEKAVKWYREAADQGLADAQYNLGNCFYNGEGVEQDYEEAVKWYREAAEQGNITAQASLAKIFLYGLGVPQNLSEAEKWCKKARQLLAREEELRNPKAGTRKVVRVGVVEVAFRWCPPGTKTDGFWMGETQVTQGLWKAVMGENPSHNKSGDNYPAEAASWNNCQTFLKKLNALPEIRESGVTCRLPTEAEWETACRAGATGDYCRLADGTEITEKTLGEVAWYHANSGDATHPVGQKKSNAFGLYDMLGNVWEWTSTAFCDYCVLRGGSYWNDARDCRSADRIRYGPDARIWSGGLRLLALQDAP